MKLEEIGRRTTGLEDIPKRTYHYNRLEELPCCLVRTVRLKGYTFDLYYFSINGNGKIHVRMFDSDKKELFSYFDLVLEHTWMRSVDVEISYGRSFNYNYVSFSRRTDFDLESALFKFVLVAEKYKEQTERISVQYYLAYLIYLFYNRKSTILATDFSSEYKIFVDMKELISGSYKNNRAPKYSKETIYYKVLDRFIEREKEYLKNKELHYN